LLLCLALGFLKEPCPRGRRDGAVARAAGKVPGRDGSADAVRARLAHGKQVGDAKPAGEVRRRAAPLTANPDGRERAALPS